MLNGTDGAEVRPTWIALRVRSNREKQVTRDLEGAGIEAFLPIYTFESRWSDRTKTIQKPLFPGYVFARVATFRDTHATRIRGVVQSLGPVSDSDIAAVRKLTESMQKIEPCAFAAGDLVTVESGPMAGQSGVVTRTKGALRLVVNFEIMRRSVAVELDANTVVTCGEAPEKELRRAA